MKIEVLPLLCVILLSGCIQQGSEIEYQCWDGSVVSDPMDCPSTTTTERTTTTTTTTTLPCQWTDETCRIYCSRECDARPLEFCRVNETVCRCEYECGTTTTTTATTTTTTLRRWLTEEEVDEAVDWGVENRFDLSKMLSEYSYPNYTVGYEHVIVYTPYLNLALEAASKARGYRALNQSEIDDVITDREIMFRVKLYGDSQDFADDVKAVIKLRGEVIHPMRNKFDDTPETTAYWPDSPAYFAVNTYVFEDYEVIRDRMINFIVIEYTGEETYRIDMKDYQ